MDEAGRKKLVDKLAKPARFDKAYEEADRQWCVDKLIRILGAQGTTDAGMEAAVTAVLTKAKTVVAAQRDFKVGVKLDKKRAATERASTGRRVEILYGLIATDPKLVDSPGNIAMLSFIARRRYRSIERMALFVNPNGRGYFRYPDTCSTNFSLGRWHWKVNVVASKFWEPVVAGQDVPIWLKNPPDAPAAFNPEAAIASLFTQKDAACEGNLLDCATTMNVVLMDSLMEGNKPKDFAATLAAKNPIYLSIVHVNPPIVQPEAFFLTDPTAEGLFVKGGAALEDLQVGDHVYIRNHQLYKTLRPTGSWSGEHALVTDCGNRHIDSDKGFKFMGHGMPHGGETGAIPRFYKGLLNEINTHLHRSFRLAAIFLNYLKSNKTSIPAAKVQAQSQVVTDLQGITFTVDYYFFDVDFSYTDFDGKKKNAKLPTKKEHGFVVAHAPTSDQFFLHHRKTLAAAMNEGVLNKTYGILFQRDPDAPMPLDTNEPTAWDLIYTVPDPDDSTRLIEVPYELFERTGRSNTLSMVELPMKELFSEPLARVGTGSSDVFTTRHRVSLDAAYLTFLKGAKALP